MSFIRSWHFHKCLIVLCMLASITMTSCTRKDVPDLIPQSNLATERFLKVNADNPAVLNRIAGRLRAGEKESPYIGAVAVSDGYPSWDNTDIILPADDRKDTMAIIPLVLDSTKYVNSFIVAHVNGDRMNFVLISGRNYYLYGFSKDQHTFSGNLVAKMLMLYDRRIFGDTTFAIYDDRVFETTAKISPKAMRYAISHPEPAATDNGRLIFSTQYHCSHVTVGVHEGDQGQLHGLDPSEDHSDYSTGGGEGWDCQWITVIYDIPGGDGTGSTGTGNGNGTTPVGSSGSIFGSGGSGGGGGISGGTGGVRPPGTTLHPPAPDIPVDPVGPIRPGALPIGAIPPSAITWNVDENGYFIYALEDLAAQAQEDPNALLPCPQLALLQTYTPFYNDLNDFVPDQQALDRAAQLFQLDPAYTPQFLSKRDGAAVNTDFFPLKINRFPVINGVQTDQTSLLEYFRLHMNSFISNGQGVSFNPYVNDYVNDVQKWNYPFQDAVGSLIHITLPNDGTVMMTAWHATNVPVSAVQYTFTTMSTPLDGFHPVTGNRQFGVYENADGSNTFYIGGMDRITNTGFAMGNALAGLVNMDGFKKGDELWTNIRDNMMTFINQNGGAANKYDRADIKLRLDYGIILQFLHGEIDYPTFRQKMGC